MSMRLKGIICGIIAAISYGTNPLGALFLYEQGINTNSVLFYRFSLAAAMLGALMLWQGKSFRVRTVELVPLAILGVLFAISSLALFSSFHYIDVGIACTILFIYPAMVAVMMALFFKEKLLPATILSIIFALVGIGLLYKTGDNNALSTVGILLVMLSAFTYALYIIIVNKSVLELSAIKLTFYVLLFCSAAIVIRSLTGEGNSLQILTTPSQWMLVLMLALIPTVISLITMVLAIHSIGSTPTAVLGALEPLTAVVIGIAVFNEALTLRLCLGILMILAAVILIIIGNSASGSQAQ